MPIDQHATGSEEPNPDSPPVQSDDFRLPGPPSNLNVDGRRFYGNLAPIAIARGTLDAQTHPLFVRLCLSYQMMEESNWLVGNDDPSLTDEIRVIEVSQASEILYIVTAMYLELDDFFKLSDD